MSESCKYHLVCGMEVHAELKTNSKMFCGCKNDPFGAEKPNSHTCPVCLGMPGALPVANKKAIEWTIKLGLALNCKINLFSKFDRKNYFYPDLPKAYQISQYDIPFCYEGVIETSHGPIRITRIHLEEDTGKLLHKEIKGEDVSLIDYNRSSVPLIEIVTEPDIKSPEQAEEYGRALRDIIRYLDIGNCDMEQGGMRLEANISLQENGKEGLPNYKTEVKNINSFKFAKQAIEFEMERQEEILEEGNIPKQETRGWDAKKSVTFSQRTKEDAEDYRYFPDPDLPPIRFTTEQIEKIRKDIPKLPHVLVKEWKENYGVEERYSSILFNSPSEAKWLEELFVLSKKEGLKANKLVGAMVNKNVKYNFTDKVESVINEFKKLNKTDDVSDDDLIKIIDNVIKANADTVARYKAGEKQLINFFFGQTMKALGKKVDGGLLRKLLTQQLDK
ncbi:MAG: Asp-tRNA(Asn)/Glu-tRNA(Gln) amidotransferase subunit GatB [Candidatus Pacebacteria bacterium]|nr:Asp-tRNA(Asn)/Glu-tRNA(Gln) amidotransferase subunit GatB [Candidatus Paceibacterota bacterium]